MLASLGTLLVPVLLGGAADGPTGGPAGGGPELLDIHPTYGQFGAPRPKNGILPGDTAHVSFNIKGLKTDKDGKVAYAMAIVITDATGKVVFEQKPLRAVAQHFFGGDRIPAAARVDVPFDSKPGPLNWIVTVTDCTTNRSTTLKGAGKILPPDFGLVQVGTFADADGLVPVSPVGLVGDRLNINFAAVGFGRDKKGQPDLKVTLRILDDKGKPTLARPLTGIVHQDLPADARLIPMQFGLSLDRPGRYTVELTAQCQVCGKTTNVSLPVRILSKE